jgi:serine/threonine-protein kinase
MGSGSRATIGQGTQLNGIYEIDEPLATGGMGEIYRGHAIQTGDAVAIKLIRTDLAEDESALALFRREASALHSIHHEAIVRYFVFSIDPMLQRPYLAMEFVEGSPLGDILSEGRLPLDDVMALKQRVASGLYAAHQAGIVHRDIAPDNILVKNRDFSSARIIDFGIARSTRPGEATVIGSGFAGKYNYVSPEQLGLFDGEVTVRSDIYSLGLVLAYACLGKRIDMGGSQVEVIEKRRTVPDLHDVYPEIRPLLARMLNPDPALRPATMREIANWQPEPVGSGGDRTIIKLRPSPPQHTPGTPAAVPTTAGATVAAEGEKARLKFPFAPRGAAALALTVAVVTGAAAIYFIRSGAQHQEAQRPEPIQMQRAEPPAVGAPNLEPAPTGPQNGVLTPAERMLAFIAHYKMGGCAFLTPVKVGDDSAQVDGFGVDAKQFEAFDKAFTQATHIEADIAVRKITRAQCPAADFLALLGGSSGAPRLSIKTSSIRSGEVLSGVIATDQPNLELLIVDDEGKAYNVTSQVRGSGSDRPFAMRLQKAAATQAHPMLLIAVTSASPLKALNIGGGVAAEALFRAVSEEIAGRPDVKATTAYFQIE